ncbi:MAG: 5'-nucleotidase, partial [Eubacterium sp.]
KKEAALKILDFISTEDGQKLVAAGSAITNSYIDDISLTPKDESVTEVLEAGRFMAEPVFERGMEDTLGKALHAMVTQGLSPDDAIKMCDEKNTSYQTEITSENTDEQTVLGRATDFFPFTYNHSRSQELAITNFVSDAMRESTGTDIALEYGTIVKSELFKGTITKADLKAILRNDLELYTLDVTGQQIHDLIAEGLSDIYSPLFIVPSGLCYEYSLPKNGEGQKLLKLTLSNGSPLDMDKTYTVTVSSALLSDTISSYTFHGLVAKKTDKTLMGALQDTIEKQKSISPKLDRRIVQK